MSKKLLVMLLVAGLVSACGGAGDVSEQAPDDSGQTETEPNDPGPEPEGGMPNEDNAPDTDTDGGNDNNPDTDLGDGETGDPEETCLPGGHAAPEGDFNLPELGHDPAHNHDDEEKGAEHLAALALVDYADVTHAAIGSGVWCNPEIWHNQQVPGDNARVVIPDDAVVTHNSADDARLATVRVDGRLEFSTSQSSRMRVDTLFVSPGGELVIGTAETPVAADVQVEILIADNGNIDTAWDPMLLSRGLLSHGKIRVHGAPKTPYIKVATAPQAGDDYLSLSEVPDNWQAGDRIVIAGTRYSGWKWDNDIRAVRYFGTQDEVREIVAVDGHEVTIDTPLEYDHFSPRDDLQTRVANFSRNVTVATENAAELDVHQRGHVMFMHNNATDVRYAAFIDLGRTDKSVPSTDVEDLSEVSANSNVRGRYSFHIHRTGTKDQRAPAVAVGNAVFNSPGWGYVHHDSHAVMSNNVSYDTHGAGFVAETGNETGVWSRNFAIGAKGTSVFNPKNGSGGEDVRTFDIARSGAGFWFQGRMVRSTDNLAASVNHGFVYFHRDKSGSGMIRFPAESFMFPEALGLGGRVAADDVPIRNFDGNEAFASTVGLYVVKAGPIQNHDVYTELTNFTAWEVRAGAAIEYTAHYLLKNFDLIGSTPEPFRRPIFGIEFGNNTSNMVVNNAKVQSFPDGIRLGKHHTDEENLGLDQFVIIGGEYIDVDNPLPQEDNQFDPATDLVLEPDDLSVGTFNIDMDASDFPYTSPDTGAGAGTSYHGQKTDSIGQAPLPGGVDRMFLSSQDMIAIVSQDGYFRDQASGDSYTIVEQYFSDRATGEVHKRGLKTRLEEDVVAAMINDHSRWSSAVFQGAIDLASQSPVANDVAATTSFETEIVIDVIANDTDPEGDDLTVDEVLHPRNGSVFDNGDGTLTYRPDFGFSGTDRFYYWVTDGQGNFSKADVVVDVVAP